jgi:hypothetical protein
MAHAMRRHVFMFNLLRLLWGVADYAAAIKVERTLTRSYRVRRWFKFFLKGCVPSEPPFACDFSKWKQPFKVGLALALSSLWLGIPALQALSSGRGIWAGITICFVVSPDVGNAVLKSFNRLQGTMLASMFALATMQLAGGQGDGVLVALMCAWVVFTCQFRGGTEHGYAAVVAAFTVPIFFFGAIDMPDVESPDRLLDALTMARMEMTALGVAIYLFVEVAVWRVVPRAIVRYEAGRWFGLVASFIEACATAVEASALMSNGSYNTLPLMGPKDPRPSEYVADQPLDITDIDVRLKAVRACGAKFRAFLPAAHNSPSLRGGPWNHVVYMQLAQELVTCERYLIQIREAATQLRSSHDETELRAVAATLRSLGALLRGSCRGLGELLRADLARVENNSEPDEERGGGAGGQRRALQSLAEFRQLKKMRDEVYASYAARLQSHWFTRLGVRHCLLPAVCYPFLLAFLTISQIPSTQKKPRLITAVENEEGLLKTNSSNGLTPSSSNASLNGMVNGVAPLGMVNQQQALSTSVITDSIMSICSGMKRSGKLAEMLVDFDIKDAVQVRSAPVSRRPSLNARV